MTDTAPDQIDPLAFTPVSLARARHDGWTARKQQLFIDRLALIGLVSAAAKSVGMSAKSAYALRKRSGAESFVEAWDTAVGMGLRMAHSIAIDRAIHGVRQPIYYQGRQVGERTVYNDRLLITALRRYYQERNFTSYTGDVP